MRSNIAAQSRRQDDREGFTLLELLVAFAILALFVVPMLEIVHRSRVRAFHYTRVREVQDLAQRKLFERIYYYSEETILAGELQEMSGTFTEEGRPTWEWEIPYPEIVSQGEQVLLQYTILIFIPELGDEKLGSSRGGSSSTSSGRGQSYGSYHSEGEDYDRSLSRNDEFDLEDWGRQPSFEMSTWTFPSEFWYEEQAELAEQGIDTGYGFGGYGGYGGYSDY